MNNQKNTKRAILELALGCLEEAVERLHRLCKTLHDAAHEAECTEVAGNISAQIAVLQRELPLS